jgi:precorrin-2 dehydrogenase/sirohydrochlorin ferrochelatase
MDQGNQLFPVFFRLDQFEILVVGGGGIGLEKLTAIFQNCSNAKVTLVAPQILEEIKVLANSHTSLKLFYKEYESEDLSGKGLAIAATTIKVLNLRMANDAKARHVMINVADTPELCDFYLSSIVRKGDLKIAISTNGKSPTFAKRIRELLEEVIPENISNLLDDLKTIQKKLKGDFAYKVKKMNEITTLLKDQDKIE